MKYTKALLQSIIDQTEYTREVSLSLGEKDTSPHDKLISLCKSKMGADGELLWITVNVKPEITLEMLQKQVEKAVTKTWVQTYAYAYEFRGADSGNCGLHAHICLPRGHKKACEAIRELRNTFKTLIGTDKALDIRTYSMEFLNDKIEYLLGHKDDSEKDGAIEFTQNKRTQLGLKEIYRLGI